MTQDWALVALGKALIKSDEWIEVASAEQYKQVTVKMWGKGVELRNEVLGSEIAASRRLKVHHEQFILSRIDARHGAFGLIPNELEGAVVTNDFPVFTLNSDLLSPQFLSWMSKTASFVDICRNASEGTTNRVRLKEEKFLTTKVFLPSLEEQRRIVARIEELAGKIEEARGLRKRAIEEIKAFNKSVMGKFFNSTARYESVVLESVCSTIIDNLHSNPMYSETGVPCIRSSDVSWGALNLDTARKTSEEEYKKRTVRGEPVENDIVLVREGGGTGKAAIVEKGQRFSLGQRVMMLRPDSNKVLPKFCLYQILSPFLQEEQILPRCAGSASPHLNIGDLRKFRFLLPPMLEQQQIVDHLDELRDKANRMKSERESALKEFDALLPAILDKAFKGEL
ncbi:MAG TPA: restriction endonuclease subunit S [Coleofasciculaceae cyanobacterium]|jgi:type I restriction enzyme S subunit